MTALLRGPALASLALVAMLLACPGCGEDEDAHDPSLYLGERTAYAISDVYIEHAKHGMGESLPLALEALREIQEGTPIAEVARRRSDDPVGAAEGGFLGFLRPEGESAMSGAIQVLPIGEVGGPLATPDGFHVLYRHTHAEGRDIESRLVIPMSGFFVPWVEVPGEGDVSREQAEKRAHEAWEKVRNGSMSLLEAANEYAPAPPSGGRTHIANAREHGREAALYAAVKDTEPGGLAPVAELRGAFGVFQRERYFRAIVRHIMILHNEGTAREGATTRSKAEAEAFAKKVLAEVKPDGSNWYELVKTRSDEPSMGPLGGTIGSVTNGDLHPALEEVVRETPPGHVASRLAESPDAFHILWRVN